MHMNNLVFLSVNDLENRGASSNMTWPEGSPQKHTTNLDEVLILYLLTFLQNYYYFNTNKWIILILLTESMSNKINSFNFASKTFQL